MEIVQQEVNQPRLRLPLHSRIDLEYVWSRVPERLITACESHQVPDPLDRRQMIHVIADYMLDVLNDKSRGTCQRIATKICDRYPKSFMDVFDDQIFGKGMENLRMQIYNRVHFAKNNGKRRNIRSINDDSDAEGETEDTNLAKKRCLQHEYGCVAYNPPLPLNENDNSQELKRQQLLHLFSNVNSHALQEVSDLMKSTYSTQRRLIM